MKSSHFRILAVIAISCLGAIVYSNSLNCSFHFDDYRFIVDNIYIKNIYSPQSIWHYWYARFIVFLSLALNYHFNGLSVFGYHLFNLSVHILSAILVWWLTLLTFSTPLMKGDKIARHTGIVSLFAGLVFIAHPVQVESVTNIWQRAAAMAAMFYLASMCFYVKSRLLENEGSNQGLRKFYYILSMIMAILAMFSKENTVTLPVMVLFYEFTFLKVSRTLNWKRLIPFLLALFIIPLTFVCSKSEVFQEHHGNLHVPGGVISPIHYLITQLRVSFTYIRLVFLPLNLNLDYDYPVYKSIFDLPVLFSCLGLMSIFWFAKRLFGKYRMISFFVFFFFLCLFVPEGIWTMGDVIAEHRLYLPLAGFSIFLSTGICYLLGKRNMTAMVFLLITFIAFLSILTYQRNMIWKDDLTLWGDVIQKSPHKVRPYYNRGTVFIREGRLVEALSDYNKAIALNPAYAYPYNGRGNVYIQQGDYVQALSNYNQAIAINPDYADAYYNRAIAYYYLKDGRNARRDVNKAEELGFHANPVFIKVLESQGNS